MKPKYIAFNHDLATGTTKTKFYKTIIEAVHDRTFVYDELYKLTEVTAEEMKEGYKK